jgi:Family of unknown function (DUF6228)
MAEQPKVVEFRSDDDPGVVLRLAFERDRSGSGLDLFEVHARTPVLSCDHAVLTWNGDGLRTFFGDLVRDWRGWDGTRRWDAVEHGMSIEATHRGRVVELLFILRRDYEPDAWELRLPIIIAPGEPLAQAARATASLFDESR